MFLNQPHKPELSSSRRTAILAFATTQAFAAMRTTIATNAPAVRKSTGPLQYRSGTKFHAIAGCARSCTSGRKVQGPDGPIVWKRPHASDLPPSAIRRALPDPRLAPAGSLGMRHTGHHHQQAQQLAQQRAHQAVTDRASSIQRPETSSVTGSSATGAPSRCLVG